MAVIYPRFLSSILVIHENITTQLPYPFFDPACVFYEALRAVRVDNRPIQDAVQSFGLTEYTFEKGSSAFHNYGVAGLIGLDSKQVTEPLSLDIERMVFVFKQARPSFPATKMVTLLKGFGRYVSVSLMRHLYASYGWAQGTKSYQDIDFGSLNLKVQNLVKRTETPRLRETFFDGNDGLQTLLEIFRTMEARGITNRYPGSRVSFAQHKKNFLSLGLLGLVGKAGSPFRNSKLGFAEEGRIILSKIQHPDYNEASYLKILESKKIQVVPTCLTNIFKRWRAESFRSEFVGDLSRLLEAEEPQVKIGPVTETLPHVACIRLDQGFISFVETLEHETVHLANPGVFLFLGYLNQLQIFEKASTMMDLDPQRGYGWFSLLLLNLARILAGISSVSKACRTSELSMPLFSGLVSMPCNDSLLNGLATIDETQLLQLRQHLTRIAKKKQLIAGKRIAFDFKMRDYSGEDINLKNIGKGPSSKRKICFPGFRPHLAWDVDTGAPITLEFRNGKARATTTLKRFVLDLIYESIGKDGIEHIYLDSEYTAEHVWKLIVDPETGFGADLTMCIKQNRRVKKFIEAFLKTNPTWIYFDDKHTYSEQTFTIAIRGTEKELHCVLKRKETNGQLRCFGSTLTGLDSKGILQEYRTRWLIENGIKDLAENYFFDNIPGIDPHRINIHYFVVTLARMLYEMFCLDYQRSRNPDATKRSIAVLRPEFMVGSNATLTRVKDTLIITWTDHYPPKRHHALKNLFNKINETVGSGLPFLGGLKLRFEIAPPRPEHLHNRCKRGLLEF
ncbi:MAG: transposase [Planctomycetes bacterium]|nr:transposase [Planctomycetota bacterium]